VISTHVSKEHGMVMKFSSGWQCVISTNGILTWSRQSVTQ
jgi:hypothetical protein